MPWKIFKQSTNTLLQSAEQLEGDKIETILKQLLPTFNPTVIERRYETSLKSKININKAEA